MQLLWVSCKVKDANLVFQNNHYPAERRVKRGGRGAKEEGEGGGEFEEGGGRGRGEGRREKEEEGEGRNEIEHLGYADYLVARKPEVTGTS